MAIVLVAVDGSDHAGKAVAFAAKLARGGLQDVVLVNVQPDPDLRTLALNREAVLKAERDAATEALMPSKAALEAVGARVVLRVEHGDPAQAIVKVADETKAEHIIMGTRGLGSLAGLLMGSVATKVLHLTAVPVTLVK